MKAFKKLALATLLTVGLAGSAWALDLGSVIGGVVGGFAVEHFSEPINKFINTITFNKGMKAQGYTKVVPIVSIGSGARIGAAQVSGPRKDGVDRCQAVAQLEGDFQGKVRAKILIPIDQLNVTKGFKRVQGVGVSALIDVRL